MDTEHLHQALKDAGKPCVLYTDSGIRLTGYLTNIKFAVDRFDGNGSEAYVSLDLTPKPE